MHACIYMTLKTPPAKISDERQDVKMRAAATAAHYTYLNHAFTRGCGVMHMSEASVHLVKGSAQAAKLATHTMRCSVTLMQQTWQAICSCSWTCKDLIL